MHFNLVVDLSAAEFGRRWPQLSSDLNSKFESRTPRFKALTHQLLERLNLQVALFNEIALIDAQGQSDELKGNLSAQL
jgi:hypothetical protein